MTENNRQNTAKHDYQPIGPFQQSKKVKHHKKPNRFRNKRGRKHRKKASTTSASSSQLLSHGGVRTGSGGAARFNQIAIAGFCEKLWNAVEHRGRDVGNELQKRSRNYYYEASCTSGRCKQKSTLVHEICYEEHLGHQNLKKKK